MWNLINVHIRVLFRRLYTIGQDIFEIGYIYFFFELDFLNGVQNSITLHAQIYQIYQITNSFGGRQGGFVRPIQRKNPPKGRVIHPLNIGRAHNRSPKPAAVPGFILFGLDFAEHLYWPTSQAIGNQIDFGSNRLKTLNFF